MKANRLRLLPTIEQDTTLRDIGERVSALWNVANYVCRQAVFARQPLPTYFTLYYTFRAHPAFRALPNDIAHETLKKVAEAWKSWRSLRRLWQAGRLQDKPGLPCYRKRQDGTRPTDYIPIKCARSYHVDGRTVSLTLPPDLRTGGRLVLAYQGTIRYRGQGRRAELRYDPIRERWYMTITVAVAAAQTKPWVGKAAIDLGIRVMASLAIAGVEDTFHFVGREVVKDFEYWTAKIAVHQRELAHRHRKTSRRLKRLYAKRGARLRHATQAMARRIVAVCRRYRVGRVLIGWPKGILLETTANAKWQRLRHHLWSFDAVAERLATALSRAGIQSERVGERGTSSHCPQCGSAGVVRHPRYVLRCRACQFRCHSDQAGARNMLRQTYPDVSWAGAEAAPRPETHRWQYHRWVDVANPATTVADLRAA